MITSTLSSWILLAVSLAACLGISLGLLPETRAQHLQAKIYTEKPIFRSNPLRSYTTQRRNYFLGHKQTSDLLEALEILSASVDLFRISNGPKKTAAEVARRTEKFMSQTDKLEALSEFDLNMHEIFVLPVYLMFFDLQIPEKSLKILDIGIAHLPDSLTLPMVGGFYFLTFHRNLPLANHYLKVLYARHPVRDHWVTKLIDRIDAGEDPLMASPGLMGKVCKMMEDGFPLAKHYFRQKGGICEGKMEE